MSTRTNFFKFNWPNKYIRLVDTEGRKLVIDRVSNDKYYVLGMYGNRNDDPAALSGLEFAYLYGEKNGKKCRFLHMKKINGYYYALVADLKNTFKNILEHIVSESYYERYFDEEENDYIGYDEVKHVMEIFYTRDADYYYEEDEDFRNYVADRCREIRYEICDLDNYESRVKSTLSNLIYEKHGDGKNMSDMIFSYCDVISDKQRSQLNELFTNGIVGSVDDYESDEVLIDYARSLKIAIEEYESTA